MTPLERKARDKAYVARARAIAATTAAVLVPDRPGVTEVASREGAYVEALLWVPAQNEDPQ